ncbi:MAG: EAL domain-containing protein [Gammaproteobacteria bacterium]|jgi:diguanylate cyclase (GGDEF)-like protein/PAS domain S-box-containing protein
MHENIDNNYVDQEAELSLLHNPETRKQLQKFFDDMQTMVAIMNPDGTIVFVSNTPLKTCGLEQNDVLNNKMWEIYWFNYDPDVRDAIEGYVANAAAGEIISHDVLMAIPDGTVWIEFSCHPVFDDKGDIVQLVAEGRDISQRKAAEEKVLQQAHFDSLTDLPNRFLTLDRLSQLLIDAERNHHHVAVLFLDLDDFKKINDSLGHEVGDKLLIEAAHRLNSVVRSGDTVGRLGGDEFIVLLGSLRRRVDSAPVIENIITNFRNIFNIDNRELMVTTSIGVAIYPTDGKTESELLRNADSAMYHSKKQGRNTFTYYTADMNRLISRQLAIEEQMHGALFRKEFEVHYQPKFDLSNGKIVGAEALLRWSNPVLGDVSPDSFIPIAERSGLIIEIGEFVLIEALKQTANWLHKLDNKFMIAVNLSPRQFRDTKLVSFIKKTIQQSGVSPNHLELEITEGVLMSGLGYIDTAINNLSKLDISLAMDDFGTGYSSLSYLRNYPFNVLKIDRSFINDMSHDNADKELTNAAVAMAHAMKMTVVAEGVETDEQLKVLKNMGCDYGQGYLLGRPMTANQFNEFIDKN